MIANQDKLAVLRTFLESVSWADECEIITTRELYQPSITVLQSPASVYFPCHWTEFDYWKNQCWNYYNWPFQSRPILLIYGNPPLQEAERMRRDSLKINGYAAAKCVPLILDFIEEYLDFPTKFQDEVGEEEDGEGDEDDEYNF